MLAVGDGDCAAREKLLEDDRYDGDQAPVVEVAMEVRVGRIPLTCQLLQVTVYSGEYSEL